MKNYSLFAKQINTESSYRKESLWAMWNDFSVPLKTSIQKPHIEWIRPASHLQYHYFKDITSNKQTNKNTRREINIKGKNYMVLIGSKYPSHHFIIHFLLFANKIYSEPKNVLGLNLPKCFLIKLLNILENTFALIICTGVPVTVPHGNLFLY